MHRTTNIFNLHQIVSVILDLQLTTILVKRSSGWKIKKWYSWLTYILRHTSIRLEQCKTMFVNSLQLEYWHIVKCRGLKSKCRYMWMPFIVIPYFVLFLFGHCVVCHSSINGLWFLQTFLWDITKPMKYFFLSCYYEHNQEKIDDTKRVIRIEMTNKEMVRKGQKNQEWSSKYYT